MNNIQVQVEWKSSTIFAGEPLECTITLTNASNKRTHRSPSPGLRNNSKHRDRWKETRPSHLRSPSLLSTQSYGPSAEPPSGPATIEEAQGASRSNRVRKDDSRSPSQTAARNSSHRRSISIVSIGNDGNDSSRGRAVPPRQRPIQSHVRAASMQLLPRRGSVQSPHSKLVANHDRAFTLPFPNHNDQSPARTSESIKHSVRPEEMRRFASTSKIEKAQLAGFRFPPTNASFSNNAELPHDSTKIQATRSAGTAFTSNGSTSTIDLDHNKNVTKVLSPASIGGTPRSSGEFFSMSNNSTETLMSEYNTQESHKLLPNPVHRRQGSSLGPQRIVKAETLMMGYAQITGSFSLDGSLVNQSPFEEVKRKAIIGGQGGGGLVRSQSVKRDSGLLSSFGWGNLGETFGGLLSDTGMSSIKEAKKSAANKTIPVLSAPQSVLFVDLSLSPGESRTYRYVHPVPMGSPPSHRGKIIKIQYSLVVGTQRAGSFGQQGPIQKVEVPFRVLPCINGHAPSSMAGGCCLHVIGDGLVLGHDLMAPHILLSNSASVATVQSPREWAEAARLPRQTSQGSQSTDGLLAYATKLLEQNERTEHAGLVSPTEDETSFNLHTSERPVSMKDMIENAIVRGNIGSSKRSANRFEINRNGEKVAIVMLPRSSYRLGESIPVVIDFQGAEVACYSLYATLESSETVEPTIALRSKASIQRVTRKVFATQQETTVSSERIYFSPMIPTSATPDFITSGVNLEWRLRFEFVTDRNTVKTDYEDDLDGLMEEVAKDDRGTVKAAIQGLSCDTFEVAVPVRVFGATPAFDENAESKSLSI